MKLTETMTLVGTVHFKTDTFSRGADPDFPFLAIPGYLGTRAKKKNKNKKQTKKQYGNKEKGPPCPQ